MLYDWIKCVTCLLSDVSSAGFNCHILHTESPDFIQNAWEALVHSTDNNGMVNYSLSINKKVSSAHKWYKSRFPDVPIQET